MTHTRSLVVLTFALLARVAIAADFEPDPAAVQRSGKGYRYPQAGWIVLHIEGDPYDRGKQHGRLMAEEIAGHLRCFAKCYSKEAPEDGLNLLRTLANAVFLRGFDKEYLEEMQGIADGTAEMGAKVYGRSVDLVDIVAINLWPEIMTLDWALKATPTGLEGKKFEPTPIPEPSTPHVSRCSAFAATGPATADGKIVFGHITMFMLYPSTFYNVWLDVQPTKGHRVVMQSYPGGIQSGMDYYISDSGIMVAETTIEQTQFGNLGTPLASRIRHALQYGNSIDDVVEVLKGANNGLYTNEWMIGDANTNEIAMFELGTKTSMLYRSSKNDWFGGTEGFYWGCNNTKDLAVRLETIAGTNDRPENAVWRPTDRDIAWLKFYNSHKGKIDEKAAKEIFTSAPICKSSSVDAKFTTTSLAKNLKTWATYGPPMGKTWKPTDEEKREFEEIRPMVSNPWAILHGTPPRDAEHATKVVDIPTDNINSDENGLGHDDKDRNKEEWRPKASKVIWRGTILPKSDGDVWLAAAFADYHRVVEKEKSEIDPAKSKCPCQSDMDKAATSLFQARSRYYRGVGVSGDTPLRQIQSRFIDNDWYQVAAGKGMLVLSELRRTIGDDAFIAAMDSFGVENGGKTVDSEQFIAHVEAKSDKKLDKFFEYWLNQPGLPRLKLVDASVETQPDDAQSRYRIVGTLKAEEGLLPATVEVTVDCGANEKTETVDVDPANGQFSLDSKEAPSRITIDRFGRVAKANGGRMDIKAFMPDLEHTLIVYGTLDDAVGNREAAEMLQDRLRTSEGSNVVVGMVSDRELTDEMMKSHHLVLIGRPGTNAIADRLKDSFPVQFGPQSFTIRIKTYAHMDTALIVAGRHPLNERYALVMYAGLSAEATVRSVSTSSWNDYGAEIKILPHGQKPLMFVAPCPELSRELTSSSASR
ncbi:MAG: hypothetical protein HY287_09205 [Planctomycetes bacterium]|nr:hypothetical protein [Planctomycetota bacterium]MBI3834488.1 hypothetical protein [Planctomycetota bacterium]